MSDLMSFLLPLRMAPMIKMRIKATMAIAPTRKNLEWRMLLMLKPDLPLLGATGLELWEI